MEFVEMGKQDGKTLMLLPGTACDYQTNFAAVLDRLGEKYHLICVNYDGFDGSDLIFPDIITVTEKIETYIQDHFGGRLNGAIGSSLGSTFVGQLYFRKPGSGPEREIQRLAPVKTGRTASDQLYQERKKESKNQRKAQELF